jgi:polysaccharide biosynthesis transport protein
MDLSYLLNILWRRKWLLFAVVLLAATATWFIVGSLPPVYKAKSVISTGIIEYKGRTLEKDNPYIQQFQIESSFNGLVELMKSRSSINLLTGALLAHDMSTGRPFRIPKGDEYAKLKTEIDEYPQKLQASPSDSSGSRETNQKLPSQKVAAVFHYDFESLTKKLKVNRVGKSDLLSIEFDSESPELSFFVVTAFIDRFFAFHEEALSHEENLTLNFHKTQVGKRKTDLDAKIKEINDYKKANGLIDVETQRESVIGHLKDLEVAREEQSHQVAALQLQIGLLNKKILEYNRYSGEDYAANLFLSEDFTQLDSDIKDLQEKLIERRAAGKTDNAALEARINLLRKKQAGYIGRAVPLSSKTKDNLGEQVRSWIMESVEKQLELEYSTAAVKSYDAEIAKQQDKSNKLLLDDNHLTTLEASKDRLEKEYLRASQDYDQEKLFAEGTEYPLSVVEPVELPDEPEPSKRALFSAFAGMASGAFASVLLFFLAFVDRSIQSPLQFERATKLPLLGYVNGVKVPNMNLQTLFAQSQKEDKLELFKEHLRKLRTSMEATGKKSFLFVSPKEQEGKSFLIVLLAYALSLNNKRVLIIDTNFKNNTLSGFKTKDFIEINTTRSFGYTRNVSLREEDRPVVGPASGSDPRLKNIDIIGNKGGSQSPSEVLAGKDFQKVMVHYAAKYDFILMEAAAMNRFADARELMGFAEKVVAVFSSRSAITNADKETLEFLQNLNGKLLGGILNNVDLKNL